MSSDWIETSLSDLADINPRRPILKGKKAPFIDMAALPAYSREISGKIVHREFRGSGSKFQNGDTLLARITPCLENGKTALVNCLEDDSFGHGSTEFIVLGPKSLKDTEFLYYLARCEDFRSFAIARMEGTSGRQRVPNSAVGKYVFMCPNSEKRAEIGKLLSSIDDCIKALRETNATLEAMAQAIFKSWFVDFDPVHAKMEGRVPDGMDAATAALFPDSFEESELGLIPKGWHVSNIGKAFILTMGQSPPGDTYNESGAGLPFYQGRTDFGIRFPTQRMFCTAPNRIAEAGDTLVSVRAPVGDVNMAIEKCCLGRGVAGIRHPLGFGSFVFYSAQALRIRFKVFDTEGTVFGSINKKDFQELPVVEPDIAIYKAFNNFSSIINDQVVENEKEIRTLATLRDTLLPRLISGQLRIPESPNELQT